MRTIRHSSILVVMFFIVIVCQSFVSVHANISSSSIFDLKAIKPDGNVYADIFLIPVLTYVSNNQSNEIELKGTVTKVVDGDTLDINGIRIRLALVDTPERGQLGYDRAKHFVQSLCLGKNGELNIDSGQRRGDRYGREVGVVYCDGVNVNDKLMANNMARILVEFCDITEFSNENWTATQCQGNR